MLTADGTRPSARAAAEKEPWSSTAKKIAMLSDEKAITIMLSEKLTAADFNNQQNTHIMRPVVSSRKSHARPETQSRLRLPV
ncbi:hypothetical protein [Duganella radicis]|uniref:hypothetical protein n=1 Tax=Duganella radicis TaxID=551988 RepID=UPI0014797F65|nr:hypothetical protein [Duganella radicis]